MLNAKHKLGSLLTLAVLLLGVRAPVLADSSGPINPFPITGAFQAQHIEDRDHISIIEFVGNYDKELTGGVANVEPRAVVAQEFFRTHPDNYDFVVAFSTFEFETGEAEAFHWSIQNKVQGIGIPEFDITSLFGSNGKLQGFIDMAAVSRYATDPLDPAFEGTLSIMAHEMLHQWGIKVRFKDTDGSNSDLLLGRDGSHWNFLLNTNASVEYGNLWKDNGDGSFTSVGIRKFFSPLDLYLMGFYKPEEVPPFFLIENPDPPFDRALLPQENVTVSGTKRFITIDDIIAAEGPRIPTAEDSQKQFRLAFVLLVGPDEQPTDAQIAALNHIRSAFMTRFAVLTGGRAVAEAFPEALPVVEVGTPTTVGGGDLRTEQASLDDGLAWLRGEQTTEGFWEDKLTTRLRDTTVTLQTLARLDLAFTGAGQALQWLNDQPSANSDYLARHAATISELGGDAVARRAQLVALQNADGGWGITTGFQSSPLDTALTVLALAGRADVSATVVGQAVQYLLRAQNADGGWSNAVGGASRAHVTTTVLQALKATNNTDAPAIANALAWLASKQNADGGFGDSPSTVHDTANVLQAFMAFDDINQINANNATSYLLTRQAVEGSWDGSTYATSLAVAALKRFTFLNWSVTPQLIAEPASPRDGERVKLTIGVSNDGNAIAPPGVLRVFDGDPDTGGTPIGPDITIPLLAPGASVTFNPLWDTFDKPGSHTLVAVADPDGVQAELSELDNRGSVAVNVQPAPDQPDLAIETTDITIAPPQPGELPITLGISANVRNLGKADANNARILLWEGPAGTGTLLNETTVDVLQRSTLVVNLTHSLVKSGTTTFTIQVDADNAVVEVSETNNEASASITTTPTVDLEVTSADISIDKNPALVGDDVTFTVTLRNKGTLESPPTQVRYLVTDGNTTTEIRTNTVQIAAGGTIQQDILWRVDLSGALTFTAQLDPGGLVIETNEANNVATFAFTAGVATGPNLVTSFQDITFEPNPALEGADLTISAVVRNTGTVVANNVEVAFFNGDPQISGTQIGATQIIPTLAVGGLNPVSVVLSPVPDSAGKLIFVVVDPNNNVVEFSEEDNSAFETIDVLSLPDLAISSGDLQLSPAFPKASDTVVLTARATNLGQQAANNVLVRAFDGDPASGGVQVGADQTIVLIEGNGAGLATFSFTLASTGGARPIVVQVDPDNTVFESDTTNNVARRDIAVQDGNFFVSNPFFSPDGDGILDTTTLFFRLDVATDVSIEAINKRDEVVRRFSGPAFTNVQEGNVTWDGLDDLGRVVRDGRYRLRVLDSSSATLGEVAVNADTNRSSLLEALGTRFENFTNLTCELPFINELLFTEDESSIFFRISSGSSPDVTFPKGIYRMAGDGTDIQAIVPEAFFDGGSSRASLRQLAVSADGSTIAFTLVDFFATPDRFELLVADGDGGNLRLLETLSGPGGNYLALSPDAQTIYINDPFNELRAIATDGVTPPQTLFVAERDLSSIFATSPDGKKVAFIEIKADFNRVLTILDLETGETKSLFVRPNEFAWSPDGSRLAVLATTRGRDEQDKVLIFDRDGNLVKTFDQLPLPPGFSVQDYTTPQWASSGTEFAFRRDLFNGDTFAFTGGIFRIDLLTVKSEQVAELVTDIFDFSYHVSTWGGSAWVKRGKLHYGLRYHEKELDLSKYLPDPDGEYKVRIRQIGKEAAHVDSVSLLSSTERFLPSEARLLANGNDVKAKVLYTDYEVLDLFGAEMEVRWTDVHGNYLRLALTAREEDLSRRKARPFSYPAEPGAVYNYVVREATPLVVDGAQTAQDGLGAPLFNVYSKPNTGHPAAEVFAYMKSDDKFLYAALDFAVDNTLDDDKDWAALQVRTPSGWKTFKVTSAENTYGVAGFTRTGKVSHTHKYYEFKIPLSEIGAREGDTLDLRFRAYGTAAILDDEEKKLPREGKLFWAPGERALIYNVFGETFAILLDENNRQERIFEEWINSFDVTGFSPTGRQLLFRSNRARNDPTSICFQQGFTDDWSFRSSLNLTADLRAIRSATAGGVLLRGTATDLNFSSWLLEYTPTSTPDAWRPILPASGQPVVDDLFTTWVPPAPDIYFVRLTVSDLAGNQRSVIKRVSWADTPSITDLFRTPTFISPNGDGIQDEATIHYRVLEPVHLEFDFFNEAGDRVRTIARDHGAIGAEIDLIWDGRDDSGLPVPDGEYRMTVQNYEFFISVDATPPDASITLQNAYQPLPVLDIAGNVQGSVVSVAPAIAWQITEANYLASSIETGEGANPLVFDEFVDPDPQEKGDGAPTERSLSVTEFTNQRFRVVADDAAGNRTTATTPLGAEELIVSGFGVHLVEKISGSLAIGADSSVGIDAKPVADVPFVPLGQVDGAGPATPVQLGTGARFEISETIRSPLLQVFIQFRTVDETTWQETLVQEFLEFPRPERFSNPTTVIPDHKMAILWDLLGVPVGQVHVVRLRAIDAEGDEHLSNSFRLTSDGINFRGLIPENPSDPDRTQFISALLNTPIQKNEHVLWGQEFVGEPLPEVHLFIKSSEDPRYPTFREVGVSAFPDVTFIFRTTELESCTRYTGFVEARAESGKTFKSGEVDFTVPCLALKTEVEVVPAGACDAPSQQKVLIRLAPSSLDGSELKLLTLSRFDPGIGEDVLFNVNNPDSVKITAEQSFPFEFELDTSALAEGPFNLTARLINVDDQETSVPVVVIVDHTPPTLAITSPLEGQQLCGIPRELADGTIRSVLPIEGTIDDAGGFHYILGQAPGANPAQFITFHDSRSLDSTREPPKINPALEDFHLNRIVGPLGELFDKNGEHTVQLRVFDRGGFEQCVQTTFIFDGLVEVRAASVDRRLFSPNGDGVLDEVTVSYDVNESVTLDIDVHRAVKNTLNGKFSITGPILRKLENQLLVLGGASTSVWDGRDDGGNVVPDDFYGVVLTFKDACGNVNTREFLVEVDATPPVLAITFPNTGDPLTMIVEVLGSVSDPHLSGYGVDFGVGSAPETWARLNSGERNITDEVLATWNTFGLDGAHALRLIASDTVGNTAEIQVPLTLDVRTNLITYLEATPILFSPNGDGKRETTSIRFGLDVDALVTLNILDAGDGVQRVLATNQAMSPGAVAIAWDGQNATGDVVPDGTYTARLVVSLASNTAVKQEEQVTITVDSTPPAVEITRPSEGFVTGTGGVVGTIQDAHLAEYTVSMTQTPQSSVFTLLNSGTDNRIDFTFGSLEGFEEGGYTLKVEAKDEGEIVVERIIPFTVDNTPPKVGITTPETGTILGVNQSPVDVVGTLEEINLKTYAVNVGVGAAPSTFTELVSGTGLPLPEVLAAWDVSVLADGTYTLQFIAEDKAGQVSEARVTVTVDNTPPTAVITLPSDGGFVTGPTDITGTASDANLAEYRLEVAPGEKGTSDRFSELGTGSLAVTDGVLLSWQALPPDGVNTLRLKPTDQADNESEVLVQVTVDTQPPVAPQDLNADVENGQDIRLTWQANTETDLAGYAVFRDGVRLNPTLRTTPEFVDTNLLEGRYTYTVTAFDLAGLESESSNSAEIVVDVTPPTTKIQVPTADSTVSGLLDIKGTAHSSDDFKEYRLFVGEGSPPTGLQLLRRSPVPILADILTQWNTVVLAEGAQFTVRLEAEDINGNVGTDEVTVTIDNLPPAVPTGLAAVATGADVQLTWNANSEADLLGYLVFRNDRLANVEAVVVGSLKPHAIVTTNFANLALPDGPYTYTVAAIDQAGNVSDPSVPAQVTIDTRAPHAVIVEPEDGTAFDKPLYVLATTPDTDVAQVQFQFRAAGAATWTDLDAPDTQVPFEANFDPTSLTVGDYELRAAATDAGGQVDPAPTPITVTFKDLTKPATTQGLQAQVNGGDVVLTWTANTESDLVGYHIDRTIEGGTQVRITSTPVTDTTFVDAALDDGSYRYTVSAIDVSDNEASPSEERAAVVYTPVLTQPLTPTLATTTDLKGSGIGQATVSVQVTTTSGTTTLLDVDTDANGQFALTSLPLGAGTNTFTVTLIDPAGNVSKPASVSVVSASAPTQPTGLTATVTNFDVALSWNANPETNIIGYRVFRDGQSLLPDTPITDLTATASSVAFSNTASRAVDGSLNTFWAPDRDQSPIGQWLAITWPEPRIVSQVNIDWWSQAVRAVDYDIEAWDGVAWVPVAEVRGNTEGQNDVTLSQPYRTTQVRVVLRQTNSELSPTFFLPVRIAEMGAMHQPLVDGTSFADTTSDGNHEYTVTAVNEFGFESVPSEPAQAAVGDVVPPDPVTLSATVAGSDVTLTWTSSASTDVARYDLFRDGARFAEHTDLANLSFVDVRRPNGTYRYTVKAVDAVGNQSDPSNEAVVTVSVAPPAAPINLAVNAVPTGGALDLSWAPGTGLSPAAYRILRSTVSGGPYETVTETTETTLRDSGLTNGTTYFYVVIARDAVGNASAFSGEASGTPADVTAPDVPSLHFPTRPGTIFVTDQEFVSVIGTTEPGATVSLLHNGVAAGETTALSSLQRDDAQISDEEGQLPLSPDGRRMALVNRTDDGDARELSLYDFATGTQTTIATVNGFHLLHPSWSHDGDLVVFTDVSEDTFNFFIRAYRLSDNTLSRLTDPDMTTFRVGVLSPDGTQLAAVGEKDGQSGLWKLDLTSGTATLLFAAGFFELDLPTLQWSPDGSQLVYLRTSPTRSVEIVNASTGTVQVVDTQAGFSKPRWSPDGSAVLFTSRRDGGVEQVWRFELAGGTSAAVTVGPDRHNAPQWSPDGKAIAYVRENQELLVQDLVTGEITIVASAQSFIRPNSVQWVRAGHLAADIDFGNATRLLLPGRFEFKGVQLSVGDNVFSASARDDVGNTSAVSEAIVVTLQVNNRTDLSVEQQDLVILPAAPIAGEHVRVSVTVRNKGAIASPAAEISLTAIDPLGNGITLAEGLLLNPIPAGGSQTVLGDLTLGSTPGTYTFVAVVDPFDQVPEVSEANNLTLRELIVAGDARPVVTVTTDAAEYQANQDVTASVKIFNSGDTYSGRLEIVVEDNAGFLVQSLLTKDITGLAYTETLSEEVVWNTGSTFAGSYRVHARLFDAQNNLVAEGTASLNLLGNLNLSSGVITDRGSYGANADVLVTGTADFTAGNAPLIGAEGRLRVVNSNAEAQAETTQAFGDLLPGTTSATSLEWNTGLAAIGDYQAVFEVVQAGQVITSATTSFTIVVGTPQLLGTLALADAAPAAGAAQDVTFTVQNNGNAPLTQLPVVISLIDPDLQAALESERVLVDIDVGASAGGTVTFMTVALPLKTYTVLLQAELTDASGATTLVTLSTAAFSLVDRSPPVVSVQQPTDSGHLAGNTKATVLAVDDLSAVQRVEISVDGGPFVIVPVDNPVSSLYGDVLPGLAEGVHTIAARATDTFGNTATTTTLSFTVDNTPPVVVINGVTDGSVSNADVTPEIIITDDNLDTSFITLNGSAFVSGTAVTEDGGYALVVRATDKAGNTTDRQVLFDIDKTPPQVIVTGVEDGDLTNQDVVPVIEIVDEHLDTQTITLNGEPFTSGTAVTQDGVYELQVVAIDTPGNQTSVLITFEIDKTPPAAPTVTTPADGSILDEQVTDVTGQSEDSATIFLSVGGFQTSVLADTNGQFTIAQVPLEEGDNILTVFAKDRAENTGLSTTVQVSVVTLPQVDLDGDLVSKGRVLVWLRDRDDDHDDDDDEDDDNDDDDEDDDEDDDNDDEDANESGGSSQLLSVLESTFDREAMDFRIARSEEEVIEALRSRRYTTLLLDDIDDDSPGHLKISKDAGREIRATVASGMGLVWIKTHPGGTGEGDHLVEITGAKVKGRTEDLSQVVLEQSPASSPGTFDIDGRSVELQLEGGTAVGELVPDDDDEDSPAMVINRYGNGQTVIMGFDPSALIDTDGAMDILTDVLNFAVPTETTLLPGATTEVRWTASNITPPLDVRFEELLPDTMQFVRIFDGNIDSPTEGSFTRTVGSESTAFRALVQLPGDKGDSTVSAKLFKVEQNGLLSLLVEEQLQFTIEVNQDDLGIQLLDALNALEISGKDRRKLQKAMELVQEAIIRSQNTRKDAEFSINKLLKAVEKIRKMEGGQPEIVAQLGTLLGTYQIDWITLPADDDDDDDGEDDDDDDD